MKRKIVPPLKWHGGKTYLAERIIALMPSEHRAPRSVATREVSTTRTARAQKSRAE